MRVNFYHGDPWMGTPIVPQSQLQVLDDLYPLGYRPLGPEAEAIPSEGARGLLGYSFPSPSAEEEGAECLCSRVLSLVESLHQMRDRGLPRPEAAPVAV